MKIIDLVHMNKSYGYVLDESFKLTYEKHGELLIGSDETGTFYDVLKYQYPVGRKEYGAYAFGGREFDLPMKDGSVIHCWGQYWSGGFSDAEKILGFKLVHIAYSTVEKLNECYVFYQGMVKRSELEKISYIFLNKNPNYEPYGYYEYLEHLKKGGI